MDIFEKIKYKVIVYGLPSLLIISYIITFLIRIFGGNQFDYSVHVFLSNSDMINNVITMNAISIALLSINLILIIGISYNITITEVFKKYWIFILTSFLLLYAPIKIQAFAKPLYFILVLLYFSKTIKPVLIGFITMVAMILYQLFILWLKLGHIPLMGELTFYQSLIFNLDQYIAMSVIYLVLLYRKKVKT